MDKKIRCEICPVIDFCPNTNPEYSMKQVSIFDKNLCPLYRCLVKEDIDFKMKYNVNNP